MSGKIRIAITCLFSFLVIGVNAQITFIIEALPNTTPDDDTIYITGTFNGWHVNDANYMLHPQLDGKYSIILPIDTGKIEFKFSRGSWSKVETNEVNEYIQNRSVECNGEKIYVAKIENWQDLGGVKEFNYIVLLLFAIGFYGISILFFAIRIQYRTKAYVHYFFLFNIALIVSLIGGVFYNQANFIWQSRIGMIGMIILYLWGPLFRFFIASLSRQEHIRSRFLHYFPALLIGMIAVLRFYNFKPLTFYAKELNSDLILGNSILISIGISLTLIYHLSCIKFLKLVFRERAKFEKRNRLVNILYFISAGSLLYLSVVFIFILTGYNGRVNNSFELMLILLSAIMFVEFYYYWKYPALFYKGAVAGKFNKYNGNEFVKDGFNYFISTKRIIQKVSSQSLPEELTIDLREKLLQQMIDEKTFKDPKLNIAGLSKIIETKPHILSRVLNEQFNKNFRDFINEYRIKEFVELAGSEKYKNYTLLALSYEVGFNSKSTFNLAFKKITGLSPRNYLKNKKISLSD